MVAGGGVLSLICYLVVSGLLGRGPSGANSPEDAVKAFVSALQSKDIAAVAAALDPDEERQLVSLVEQVQTTAADGGVTSKGQEFAGVDFRIADVTYAPKNLSERVARVDITGGTITLAGVNRSKLPLALQGLTVDPDLDSLDLATLTVANEAETGREIRPFVMVVKEESGWFVSPLFTGAELLAQQEGVLGSYPDALPTATTEETADDAVTQFLKAVTSKDPESVLRRLVPQEQSVLRAYERLWRPYLEEAMGSEEWNATNLQLSLGKMTDTDLGDGSTAVAVESADLAVDSMNGSDDYSLEKDCLQAAGVGTQCLKSWRIDGSGLNASAQSGGSSARLSLVAVNTGDGFAVSLLGSAAVTSRSALTALDAKEVFRAIELSHLLPTGGTLRPGQQLTVDAASADNVTLEVADASNVELKAEQRTPSGESGDVYFKVWNSKGGEMYSSYELPGNVYELDPGSYRITWSVDADLATDPKVSISAITQ